MNRITSVLSLLAVVVALLPGAAISASIEEELNVLENRRYDAMIGGDWQSLDALLADEFFYNTATGALMTKNAFVELLKSGTAVVKKAVRDEAKVRDFGEVALVTGVAHVDVKLRGEDKTLHSRYLHVWAKDGPSWKLIARQATYLPEIK